MIIRRWFIGTLAVWLLTPALAAQHALPKRPKLPRDADTNDARAYMAYGDLTNTPWDKTHDAYYWAWRLEPNVTDYLYARYNALYFRQPYQWRLEHEQGAEYVRKSKEARLIDSVWIQVIQRDPFPHRETNTCYLPQLIQNEKNPWVAGWRYFYEGGCYQQAAEKLALAVEKEPGAFGIRLLRARALFFSRQYRPAAHELQVLLDSLRARDEKHIGIWYNTKEVLEHMQAMALLRARDIPGARAALGRALTENLAYFSAHALLSQIAMDQGQITTALQEAELAVGLQEHDGVLRFDYGTLLFRAGKLAEAEEQLKRAVELEPYWADARRQLAVTLDKQNKAADAIAAYEAYLARAPRRENIRIKEAEDRVAVLKAGGGT
jgi:tetratricopeptide (TPR) repeat protein